MNPDFTLCPVKLSRSLHGLDREARARWMLWLSSQLVAGLPSETDALLNCTASILWLRRQVEHEWAA